MIRLRPALLAVMPASLALAGCAGGEAGDVPPRPWFEEVAAQRGLHFVHTSGDSGQHLFPEIIGGGAALLDMEGDGDLDVYLVQSGSLDGRPDVDSANRLFANRGDGTFEDVTAGSGADDRGYGMGVTVGDYDNDGDPDLYVTNFGPNVLLRNDGDGHFSDVTAEAGVGDPGWGTSAAFLDYDNDDDLDLFVANYVNWSIGIEQTCYNAAGGRDYCMPTNYNAPAADRLYRNEGDGRFKDVTTAAGLDSAFGNGLGVAAADFDGNGFIDIFVANDTMMNQLWLNDGGRFTDEALLRGCALDEHGMAKAGMGVGVGDVDDDGDLDLLVVNLEGQTDSFFRNDGGFFDDDTGRVGLGGASRRLTRFGAGFVDFDNDGNFDLYQANGRVIRSAEPTTRDAYAEPNAAYRGLPDGRFIEVLPQGGTSAPVVATSRGAAFGDVDGDGGMDVVVVNRNGPVHLFHNIVEPRGGWIAFRVLDQHGRDALGARLSLSVGPRRLRRDVRVAYSYCASNDPRVHVGLGGSPTVEDVEVLWPDGAAESFGGFPAGRVIVLQKGSAGTVRP